MPGSERKEPAWRNIPVPGFVASRRDSTRQERLARQQRKKEEEESLRKRRKEQEEVMQILARKWSKEDRGVRRRHRDEDADADDDVEEDSFRRPRKRQRGGEEGDTELDAEEKQEQDDGRDSSPSSEPRRGSGRAEEEHESTRGGWQSVENSRGSATDSSAAGTATPLPTRTSAAAQKRGTEHSIKIAGVFGLSDSEGEREKHSREIELAARTKSARLSARATAQASSVPKPKAKEAEPVAQVAASSAVPVPPVSGRTLTPAEVHMKYAQWKATCNRKWVPMPEDLRRAVEAVMGK